ncbi:hypothetical protein A3Q56_03975 [Intoshia linei]|uniref:Uncharacterized protein n=1 Tax=Intoshia linei TaxID=1819745 RepID=A0A177B3V7_9BILA|nr:hypothetical protein A3Q56_03975 [Intoshia linei]
MMSIWSLIYESLITLLMLCLMLIGIVVVIICLYSDIKNIPVLKLLSFFLIDLWFKYIPLVYSYICILTTLYISYASPHGVYFSVSMIFKKCHQNRLYRYFVPIRISIFCFLIYQIVSILVNLFNIICTYYYEDTNLYFNKISHHSGLTFNPENGLIGQLLPVLTHNIVNSICILFFSITSLIGCYCCNKYIGKFVRFENYNLLLYLIINAVFITIYSISIPVLMNSLGFISIDFITKLLNQKELLSQKYNLSIILNIVFISSSFKLLYTNYKVLKT